MSNVIRTKWYSALMSGAPSGGASYYNTAGFGVAVLDALLVDGFGLVTLDSVTVSGNVATATRSAGVTVMLHQVIEIAGATPSSLNGEWRVTGVNVDAKTFTFATTGVSDGAASGTITVKTPGLGWERVFSSGHKRVYRSKNTLGPRSYFRFDDSDANTWCAKLACYESMTDIDTGFNSWNVTYGTAGFGRPSPGMWGAYGDDRTFYFQGAYTAVNAVVPTMMFMIGDYISLKPNDQANDMALPVHAPGTAGGSIYGKNLWVFQTYDSAHHPYYQWLHDDAYGNRARVPQVCRTINDVSGYGGPTFPSVADNGMFVTEHWFRETFDGPIRGKLRGAYWVLANAPMSPGSYPTFIEGVIGLEGRLCGLCHTQVNLTGTWVFGRALFDLTGPWED